MKHVRTTLLIFAAAAALLAVSFGAWRFFSVGASLYTDADTIRVPARRAPLRQILWQPATPIRATAPVDADEYEPHISADGTRMVFVRGRPGSNADLWTSRWTPDGWTPPEPIATINTPADELGPELSRDGQSLFFYSDRPGGSGGHDIWISKWEESDWTGPVNLGTSVNTQFNEYGPALTPDGASLYFSSNRPATGEFQQTRDEWPATLRESRQRHDYDLYISALNQAVEAPAVAIDALNTSFDEGAPALSPAGDFVYFASDRPEGSGGFDLFRSRRLRGAHLAAENLGRAVNSDANELDPALSMEGFRLYFSSNRAPARAAAATAEISGAPSPLTEQARYALWTSASREVFLEGQPSKAWDSLLSLIGSLLPWLLSLLLAMALLWLLRRLLSIPGLRRGMARLSLLAQCILLSLVIHALLASLLAIWKVGSQIGGLLNEGGGSSQVILTSSVDAGGVAGQLRAELSSPLSFAPEIALPRAALEQATLVSRPASFSPQIKAAFRESPALSPIELDSRPEPERSIVDQVAVHVPFEPAFTPAGLPDPEPLATDDEPASRSIDLSSAFDSRSSAAPAPVLSSATRATIDAALDLGPPAESPTGHIGSPGTAASQEISEPPATATAMPIAAGVRTDGVGLPAEMHPITATTEPSIASMPLASSPVASRGPVGVSALRAVHGPALASPPPATSAGMAGDAPSLNTSAAPLGPYSETAARQSLPVNPGVIAATPVRLPGAPIAQATPNGAHTEHRVPGAPLVASGSRPVTSVPSLPVGRASQPAVQPGRASPGAAPGEQTATFIPRVAEGNLSGSSPMASPPLPGAISGVASSIRVPSITDIPTPAETFSQRAPEIREGVLERMGGSAETERAVTMALDWFKAHQRPDGRWSGQHFDDECGKCGGAAEINSDAAITGITLLCFLSAGHTHATDGPYRTLVDKALGWLVSRQAPSGDLRRGETMYSHDIVTVALCEAFAMTRDPRVGDAARCAVSFMLAAQSESGSAGRTARERADATSVLGWQVMALASAKRCGFDVPSHAFNAPRQWLDYVSTPASRGRYAHRRGEQPNAAMTAEAMFVQQLLGHARTESRMEESARFVLSTPPRWADGAPTYFWYYATLALFEHQGETWPQWNEALMRELLRHQRSDGPAAGSWDPQDYWSRLGGRIYQTAVCTLSLEVYYRYRPAGLEAPLTGQAGSVPSR